MEKLKPKYCMAVLLGRFLVQICNDETKQDIYGFIFIYFNH